MGAGSGKKEQDMTQIRENHKTSRQTLECKATLVWTRQREKRKLRGKKDDGNGSARLSKRGRPRKKWMDLARKDLETIGAKDKDKIDRVK